MRVANSIRVKLMVIVMAVALVALFVAGSAMMINDWFRYGDWLSSQLHTTANIVNRASIAALAFNDRKVAGENLALLVAAPEINAAALYTVKGELFAQYVKPGAEDFKLPRFPESDGLQRVGDQLVLFERVIDNNEILGTLYVSMHSDQSDRLIGSFGILLAVLAVSLLAAYVLSRRLQESVTGPVLSVAMLARSMVDNRNFSLRAPVQSDDEIGVLAASFNEMLDELSRRTAELEGANDRLMQEVIDRERMQSALTVSEHRYRMLVSAIAAVTWVSDESGGWHEEFPAWAEYTGQRVAEYRGFGWRNAIHADDRNMLEQEWERAAATVASFEMELRLWHSASSTYRFVSLRAVPNNGADGRISEWIGAVTDIHDRRMAEEQVRVLYAELEQRVAERTAQLEEANKELESFSYSVSHDLRAPVRAVLGFSKILSKEHGESLSAEARRLLSIVQSEGERMGALIDDLLTFSRLGRKALQPAMIDMQGLANLTLQGLLAHHTGPQPEFIVGSLPSAMADRSLLSQVWTNLLSNALKFSAKRERPVIEIGSVSEEKEHVYFVRDNGAGFDPRYMSKLFGVFQRLHDASEYSGTGVGLALVQRIVTRHGGRVWADGVPDHGATFYFTLPREQGDGGS